MLYYIRVCFVLSFTFISTNAIACICDPSDKKLEDYFLESSTVFVGTVDNVNQTATHDTVTIKVSGSWKGLEYNQITLKQATDTWSCDFEFFEGAEYVVFADKKEATNNSSNSRRSSSYRRVVKPYYTASICGPTAAKETGTMAEMVTEFGSPTTLLDKPQRRRGFYNNYPGSSDGEYNRRDGYTGSNNPYLRNQR